MPRHFVLRSDIAKANDQPHKSGGIVNRSLLILHLSSGAADFFNDKCKINNEQLTIKNQLPKLLQHRLFAGLVGLALLNNFWLSSTLHRRRRFFLDSRRDGCKLDFIRLSQYLRW